MKNDPTLPIILILIITVFSSLAVAAGPTGPAFVRNSGELVGTVSCDGQPVQDALIYIPGESFQSYTNAAGMFRMLYVPEGNYTVKILPNGLEPVSVNDINIQRGKVTSLENVDVCNGGGSGVPTSGIFELTPTVDYNCDAGETIPVVQLSIAQLEFLVQDITITVTGAPVPMVGSVDNSAFSASGTEPGTVTITYNINGSFSDDNTWNGIFEILFSGDLTLTNCTNVSFSITGNRVL